MNGAYDRLEASSHEMPHPMTLVAVSPAERVTRLIE